MMNFKKQRKIKTKTVKIVTMNNIRGKRLKLFYATTAVNEKYTTIPVPTYVLFVNDKRLLTDSYAAYLRNTIRSRIKAAGVPIVLSPRSRVRNSD